MKLLAALRLLSDTPYVPCQKLTGTHVLRPQLRYTMSRQIPSVSEISQECCAALPQKAVSHLFSHPPVAILFGVFWRDNRRRIGGGCVTLRLAKVSQENFHLKTDRATRGVAATLTPIALHCATRLKNRPMLAQQARAPFGSEGDCREGQTLDLQATEHSNSDFRRTSAGLTPPILKSYNRNNF